VTQFFKTDGDDLFGRLQSALVGSHGRDVSIDALRSLVALEVGEWNNDRETSPGSRDLPLIGHPIRLSTA
jgi:hypothetical protein